MVTVVSGSSCTAVSTALSSDPPGLRTPPMASPNFVTDAGKPSSGATQVRSRTGPPLRKAPVITAGMLSAVLSASDHLRVFREAMMSVTLWRKASRGQEPARSLRLRSRSRTSS